VPYESGRVRVLVGLVGQVLDDDDQARRRVAHRRGGVRIRARDPLTRYLEPPIPPLPGVWVVSPRPPHPLPS
jgi:hypothetical protein